MRRCVLAMFASGALMAGSVTKDRIITMIKARTPESQIKDLIRQEGLAFKSTAAIQTEIREAGGEVSLTAFIYRFSEEYGEAPESAAAKARRTSSRRDEGAASRREEDSVRNIFYGIQVGASMPQGDLKDLVDGKTAATYGLHVDFPISEALIIRPRVDIASYSGRNAVVEALYPGTTTATTGKTVWAGVELLVGRGAVQDGGLYFGVGLGVQKTSGTLDMSGATTATLDDSKSAVGSSFLLGYQFNTNFGTELRLTSSTPTITLGGASGDFSAKALSFGLTCRF